MLKPSFQQHASVLLIVLSALLAGLNLCDAIRLNPDGGYDIVIGIEDNTPEPLNSVAFLDEIKVGVEAFSLELWKTTKKRFFINSVDVLVPSNWWTVSRFERATWQTLLGSEIRVTHNIAAPNVVNPNPCGTPGLYMELPDSFFKVARGGQFGSVGKALVNMWARYRFGVWEEHGIPGDTKFPYFYTHPSLEPKWEATGCANEEITGSFLTVDGDISDRCDPSIATGPDDDCRFIPSSSNTANSSLLHFHWMESITEFCDEKTHNYAAPNRHNLFCGHRSVWEVIKQSADYTSTKSCTETVSLPQFRILKENSSPEFYILLDRGRTITPEKVLQEVMGAMVKFIGTPSLERVNIAVGTYPHANQGKNHYYVKEEVGWAPISSVIYDVQSVLDDSSNTEGPVIRDFGLAIQEVAEKIKQRNHLAGTVILVIKRGATANFFDKLTFEQEVTASIKEDNRIKIFAIETQQGVQTPYTNLQSLVQDTAGKYHSINDTMNTARKLEGFLADMQEILEQSSIMNSASSWVTQKQYTEAHEVIEIPIHDTVNLVRVHLTTSRQMLESEIYLEQLSGDHTSVALINRAEWNENSDLSRRLVFSYLIRDPKPGSVWSLKHGCPDEKAIDCRFFLLVTAENARPVMRTQPTHRIQPMNSLFSSGTIDIDVSTSAEYNYLDLSHQGVKVVPFAIFAKIEMNQQRVLGLENVTALIRLGGDHSISWSVPLFDDGLVQPDVAPHDGIYSGVFTPLEDGLYQISVAASGLSGDGSFQDIRLVNHPGSLMPQDQINFGCKNSTKPRCISAVPRGSFSRVQDMMGTIAVENSATFKHGLPMKIMDFKATTLPNYGIDFEFTSPRLLGSDASPEEFRIYMAPHADNFIGSTDVTKHLITMIGEPPGTHIKFFFNAATKAVPYYAVEAIYGGQKSGPSNVIGVVPTQEGSLPFPTTTSTQSPTTTAPSTTTEEPTTTTDEASTSTTKVPTTTTEYPWPSTSTTTGFPTISTTEESEDPEIPSTTDYPSTSTTSEAPSTSSSTTEESEIPSSDLPSSSSTTTESPSSSSSTTEDSEITLTSSFSTSTSTTEPPEITSTTEDSEITLTSSLSTSTSTTEPPEITSTTEDSEITLTSSLSTSTSTTEPPEITSTTEDSEITLTSSLSTSTSTTEPPETTSTTEDSEITLTSSLSTSTSTTEPPEITSTTEGGSSTSTTSFPPITSDLTDPITSSTTESTTPEEDETSTAEPPSTVEPTSPSSTTVEPSEPTSTSTTGPSTTESDSSTTNPTEITSSTTEFPSSTTEEATTTVDPSEPTSTSTTDPSTTESESSTTVEPPITSDLTEISSTSTTQQPSTTEDSTTVSNDPTESTTSTTPEPSTSSTTEGESPSTSTTSESSTTPELTTETGSTSTTSESPSSSTISDAPTSTSSSTTSSESPTSTTTDSSSTTTDESSSESPSSTSPEPPSSLSTSEQASSSSTGSTDPSSSSFRVISSHSLLVILSSLSIYFNRITS